MFAASRLTQSAANLGMLPGALNFVSESTGMPILATFFQGFLASVFLLNGNFEELVTYFGFVCFGFYFLVIFGLLILRYYEPMMERPFKVSLITPMLFCLIAFALVVAQFSTSPKNSTYALLFIGAGIPVYYFIVNKHQNY